MFRFSNPAIAATDQARPSQSSQQVSTWYLDLKDGGSWIALE
jgi:hypothetical protein